jgi:hypothetical protein
MKSIRIIALAVLFCTATSLRAQSSGTSSEERFQDVFITAGYATAFGAAFGAACLSFMDNPQDHLQYVAIGASLGFIGGSILGTYLVLSPVAVNGPLNGGTLLAEQSAPNKIVLRPVFDTRTHSLAQVETAFTLWSF